ncbi:Atrophin-1 multi-domain protein [Methylophilus sp. QUAN]|nr:Atrophin-1 multi-domain protein [Methylophilus sp. QUAN]
MNYANAAELNDSSFGTYLKPFSANSLWNSKPINPKLLDFEIPTSIYYPAVQQGKYSTGVFLATNSDTEVTVNGYPEKRGLWDPDSEVFKPNIKILHWPKDVLPSQSGDGHADIIDEGLGIVHSFWQLKLIDNKWYATQYAWSPLGGSGWAEPGHYFQGARAAGVPTSAGIIRQHEFDDGKPIFEHALALSLAHNALASNPSYVFPATSADTNAATTNSGQIPEGALLMLPSNFNMTQLKNPTIIKIAQTLKTYGAYVVDRNTGTPFVIYVENGSKELKLKRSNLLWDGQLANELHIIRSNLRQVVSTDGWVDGNGNSFMPDRNLNLLSMRGPWTLRQGNKAGEFDTLKQEVVFGKTTQVTVQENYSGRSMQIINWAKPITGESFKLSAFSKGGATLAFKIVDKTQKKVVFQSKELKNEEFETFTWPTDNFSITLIVSSGVGDSSSIKAELIKQK